MIVRREEEDCTCLEMKKISQDTRTLTLIHVMIQNLKLFENLTGYMIYHLPRYPPGGGIACRLSLPISCLAQGI